MRTVRVLASGAALLALLVAVAGCGNAPQPGSRQPDPAPTLPAEPPPPPPPDAGVTGIGDITGPDCDVLPAQGAGSAQDIVDKPLATAAATTPALRTLAEAIEAAKLTPTLNSAEAITVLAPTNAAFAAFDQAEPGRLAKLTGAKEGARANKDLVRMLTYHVIGQRLTADDLVAAGTPTSVEGDQLKIGGTADAPTVNGARVLCGNIPTTNATVFVIDQVLSPPPG